MTDTDRYVAAFQGLLDQFDKQLAEAKQEVAVFAEFIQGHRKLPVGRQMKFRRRLLTLEAERIIRGGKGPIREADALLTDPASSSKLIIPELAGRILGRIANRAGRLLWAAFKDGLVTEPVSLWEHLKGLRSEDDPGESLWGMAIYCLRNATPSEFSKCDGDWIQLQECRVALTHLQQAIHSGKPDRAMPADTHVAHDPHAPYMPADWFRTKFGIPSTRLRAARRDGRLHAKQPTSSKKRYNYSVPDAQQIWPDDHISYP